MTSEAADNSSRTDATVHLLSSAEPSELWSLYSNLYGRQNGNCYAMNGYSDDNLVLLFCCCFFVAFFLMFRLNTGITSVVKLKI